MEKIHIPHIYAYDKEGFVELTKYMQEIDTDNLPGPTVENFYKEKKKLYNISYQDGQKSYMIKSGVWSEVSETELTALLKSSLSQFLSQVKASESEALFTPRDGECLWDKVEEALKERSIDTVPVDFAPSSYKESYNDVYFLAEMLQDQVVPKILKGVTTIMAAEHRIEVKPYCGAVVSHKDHIEHRSGVRCLELALVYAQAARMEQMDKNSAQSRLEAPKLRMM